MRKVDYSHKKTSSALDIVSAIKSNNNEALRQLYKLNYYKVETLVLKNNGSKEEAKDIFQEAFVATWKNIKQDKFIPENESSIHGYLYTIAKNKWMDYLRSSTYKKTVHNTDLIDLNESKILVHPSAQDHDFEKKLKTAMSAFNALGEPCKSLLKAFYFDKKSMKDLAEELALDTASVKNKKYRCMQKLRQLAQNLNIS